MCAQAVEKSIKGYVILNKGTPKLSHRADKYLPLLLGRSPLLRYRDHHSKLSALFDSAARSGGDVGGVGPQHGPRVLPHSDALPSRDCQPMFSAPSSPHLRPSKRIRLSPGRQSKAPNAGGRPGPNGASFQNRTGDLRLTKPPNLQPKTATISSSSRNPTAAEYARRRHDTTRENPLRPRSLGNTLETVSGSEPRPLMCWRRTGVHAYRAD